MVNEDVSIKTKVKETHTGQRLHFSRGHPLEQKRVVDKTPMHSVDTRDSGERDKVEEKSQKRNGVAFPKQRWGPLQPPLKCRPN